MPVIQMRGCQMGDKKLASIERQNGVLFVNPGSAGQRRYENPLSVALLHISGKEVDARIIELAE
jgi:predicted phosphodiesterase